MTEQAVTELTDAGFLQRSRVKLTTNAKGGVQPEITVVEGTTEEEMQRIIDLALRSREVLVRSLATHLASSG